MAGPLTDAELQQLRDGHAAGRSLNSLAKALGRPYTTVRRAALGLGLAWDRSKTAAAVAAHQVDMAARRTALAANLLADAERVREQLWTPTMVYNFGGKDNDYNEREFPEAPADIKRTLMQTATAAVTAHLRLVDYAARDSHDEAGEIVLSFDVAVRQAYAEQQAEPGA
jgi:hypothetical protein